MYTKSAEFYDALYHFKDYSAASEKLRKFILHYNPEAKSVLDTACGTGKHIEHLKDYFETEGLDLSPELLAIARQRCPGVAFHEADMSEFDVGKKFDVVTCLFSSIAYVKTEDRLRSAVKSMTKHLNNKGLLMIEPWFSMKNFWTGKVTSNHFESENLKITWMYVSRIENGLSVLDINYLVGTPEGISYFTEKHELGLFDDKVYRSAFEDAGLKVEYDAEGLFGRGMYIGIKS